MRRAVYAASFDPITKGHIYCMTRASHLFDELIIGVGNNPEKKYTFDLETRLRLAQEIADELWIPAKVIEYQKQYLFDFARSVEATHLFRGIRNAADLEYERTLAEFNREHALELTTIFVMPPSNIAKISSSFVKGLVGFENWEHVVCDYVPGNVQQEMVKRWSKEYKICSVCGEVFKIDADRPLEMCDLCQMLAEED